MQIKSIVRPIIDNHFPDSTAFPFDSAEHSAGLEQEFFGTTYANGLVVTIDVHEDGTKVVQRSIRFSDHAGLESEWEAGSSTTILNAVIQTMVNSLSVTTAEADSTSFVYPNSYQRSQLIDKSYTPV